jgi:hypothetical protein
MFILRTLLHEPLVFHALLLGKHGRVRSVAMPGWVKGLIDVWVEAARIQAGVVFRPVN